MSTAVILPLYHYLYIVYVVQLRRDAPRGVSTQALWFLAAFAFAAKKGKTTSNAKGKLEDRWTTDVHIATPSLQTSETLQTDEHPTFSLLFGVFIDIA